MRATTAFVLLVSVAGLAGGCSGEAQTPPAPTDTVSASLRRAQSCTDLVAVLRDDALVKMNKAVDAQIASIRQYAGSAFCGAVPAEADGGVGREAPMAASAPTADLAGTSQTAANPPAHSDTNTQVKGVDEADIVKTDGTYIYLLHGQSLRVLKAFPAPELADLGEKTVTLEGSPTEMFLTKSKIVVYSQVDGAEVYAAAKLTPRPEYTEFGFGYGTAYAVSAGPAARDVASTPPMPGVQPQRYVPLTKMTVLSLGAGQPQVEREVYFEGNYLSSRRVDSRVRTILTGGAYGPPLRLSPAADCQTFKSADDAVAALTQLRRENEDIIRNSNVSDWLPYRMVKQAGSVSAELIACEDFYVPPAGTTAYGLTRIESIDLEAPGERPTGTAIIGATDTVYANQASIYLAARGWTQPSMILPVAGPPSSGSGGTVAPSQPPMGGGAVPATDGGAAPTGPLMPQADAPQSPRPITVNWTHLHKFDTGADPRVATYVGSGTIPGQVKDQFSIDELDGNVRVTTSEDRVATDARTRIAGRVNHLYVLRATGGRRLERIGDAGEIAPTEQVMSTRFVGKRGYVVTFRQTDPLFVVDLSNPRAPAVIGNLHIPGFSEYMHPLDDGHLLTIGRDATSTGRQLGLALQIFDVGDALRPKLLTKYSFAPSEYGYSEASSNHKAFTFFADRGLLAFPYITYAGRGARSVLEVFKIDLNAPDSGKIAPLGEVDHSGFFADANSYCGRYFPEVRRGLFIEDVVYSISYGGVVASPVSAVSVPLKSVALPGPTFDWRAEAPSEAPVCVGPNPMPL